MYNLWYIVFTSIPILIIGILFLVIGCKNVLSRSGFTASLVGGFLTTIATVAIVLAGLLAIALPMIAREEYSTFINTKEMVEFIYEEDNALENAGLTSKIIELNNWLASAKASKEIYGDWSMYYFLDLDSLEYIQLKT